MIFFFQVIVFILYGIFTEYGDDTYPGDGTGENMAVDLYPLF